MSGARAALAALGAALALVTAAAPAQGAVPAPALSISSVATPTNFVPGDSAGEYAYETWIANTGGAPTDASPVTIVDTLPKGLPATKVRFQLRYKTASTDFGEDPSDLRSPDRRRSGRRHLHRSPKNWLAPASSAPRRCFTRAKSGYLKITVGVEAPRPRARP